MTVRHFLDIHDFDGPTLQGIVSSARSRKDARSGAPKGATDSDKPLAGKSLALIFERPSTRTRVSFEMAMRQLGGEVIVLNAGDMQLGRGETIADTARVLSRYVDAIMLRAAKHENLSELAAHATVPVINGLTNKSHPCQVMADILTLEEHKGPLKQLNIAWVGDGNNVASSWMEAAGLLGGSLMLGCPDDLRPDGDVLAWAQARNPKVKHVATAEEAVAKADCVMTDTWVSMHDADGARRHNLLKPYQVNRALMAKAKPDAVFMHDLPAHREEEVTAEVIDGKQSIVFDQAENRLHIQKAILLHCLGG
ncbi:MAG: ornithine carbamoyltransferase [Proteobacteria bacterium]|nr:ornithine carbamoyltransferase [Pseudomonadota bacterium]